jgi:non-canonical purine NTP pyrophosphatase (RdgB/HAM1 family)
MDTLFFDTMATAAVPVVFVTGNANKLREVQAMLVSSPHVRLEHAHEDIVEIQGTPDEIASAKCVAARSLLLKKYGHDNFVVMVEDTALGFEALGGMPGPYIKGFAGVPTDKLYSMIREEDTHAGLATCTIAILDCRGLSKDDDAVVKPVLFKVSSFCATAFRLCVRVCILK